MSSTGAAEAAADAETVEEAMEEATAEATEVAPAATEEEEEEEKEEEETAEIAEPLDDGGGEEEGEHEEEEDEEEDDDEAMLREQEKKLQQATTKANSPTAAWFIRHSELRLLEKIGGGNFGSVYRAKYHGEEVAVKKLLLSADIPDFEKYFDREVSTLANASHPNIIKFVGFSKAKRDYYLVTSFCKGPGDLRHVIKKRKDFPWKDRLKYAVDVAKAGHFLHSNDIIHRDLKSENILVGDDDIARLIDFGFARKIEDRQPKAMTMVGTDWTMAPEIMLCIDYDEKVDVFSFGIILVELMSRVSPGPKHFKRQIPGFGLNEQEVKDKAEAGCPPELIQMALDSLNTDPENRPSFGELAVRLEELHQRL